MRTYEIMFIVNPNASEEEVDKINSQVGGIITSGGGTVDKIEKMGKRRLAYEVDKHREGFYVLFVIAANGDIASGGRRRSCHIAGVCRGCLVGSGRGRRTAGALVWWPLRTRGRRSLRRTGR